MRGKIILPNFIAVLLVGLAGFFYLSKDLTNKAQNRLAQRLVVTAGLFERSEALWGSEMLANVQAYAMSKDIVDAFAPLDIPAEEGEAPAQHDKRIRQAWIGKIYRAIEMYSELWSDKVGKRPEFVFITDRNGLVLARNTTPNACPSGYNVSKAMPIFARALDGQASYSIWSIDDSPFRSANADPNYCQLMNTGLLELAAAPVWVGDAVAGVLVVAVEKSNGTTRKKSTEMNLGLAVVKAGQVHSSSLGTDKARQSLSKQLGGDEAAAKINGALDSGRRSDVFRITIEGADYLALASPVANAEPEDRIVNIVYGSMKDATADLASLNLLLVFMGVALFIVIVAGLMLGSHFLRPVMAIEEGLLKVINGEFNYRFDVKSSEVGGLSYRINQLIGVLTGEEEEEEE